MRLIDADRFKKYIRDCLSAALPEFKTKEYANLAAEVAKSFLEDIDAQPTVAEENPEQKDHCWIRVSERMPEEYDSIFKKFKGTSSWAKGMFEKRSRKVLVTVMHGDGTMFTDVLHTEDGVWKLRHFDTRWKVVAWMPLPAPYKEEQTCRGKMDESI